MRPTQSHAILTFDNDGSIQVYFRHTTRHASYPTERFYTVDSTRAGVILQALWARAIAQGSALPRPFIRTEVLDLKSESGEFLPCNLSIVQFSV